MYLDFFEIQEYPFTLTPNVDFYCRLPSHQEALSVIAISLRCGEGFVKVVGEVGSGKTLLCRLLLEDLEKDFITAYIPNPDLSPEGLRRALAFELGIEDAEELDVHSLLMTINHRLLELHRENKRVVLLIDEAQALPVESLETLRLLTNLETNRTKLLQVVLFAQPELNAKLEQNNLRQLRQRITFSYNLKPIRKKDVGAYVSYRLVKSGYTYGSLFTPGACKLLYRGSKGIPRLINILAHKALLVTYGRGERAVKRDAVLRAIFDTEGVADVWYRRQLMLRGMIVIVFILYLSLMIFRML